MASKFFGRTGAWLFLTLSVVALAACSRPRGAEDEATQDAATQDGATEDGATEDGAAPDGEARVEICNGGSEIRLAFQVGGGGPARAGEAMLAENGWQFLLVDGNCVAWVSESSSDPLVRAVLSADDAAQLSATLKVSTWNQITPAVGGCPDAPGYGFRFGEQRLSGASPCGAATRSAWSDLIAAAGEQLHHVAQLGQSWDGDLRYLVLEEDNRTDSRPAVSWPLGTAVETLALAAEQSFNHRPGGSRRATGEDAAKLRAIRTTAASATSIYGIGYDFTRVMDANGGTYQLYIRDALPFEGDDGLVPPGVF
jgi:hypothetical protein